MPAGEFPSGVNASNHDQLRDQILELLVLRFGMADFPGDWENWRIEATGATRSQVHGSERTGAYDRSLLWVLAYKGEREEGKELDHCIGSRFPVRKCLNATKLERWEEYAGRGHSVFVGYDLIPPDQDEESPKFEEPKRRKQRWFVYKCEKCGHEWAAGRRWKHQKEHVVDNGLIRLDREEVH